MSSFINPYKFSTDYNQLLLHFDGADESTTIIDSSQAARTMVAAGATKLKTDQFLSGTASLYINANIVATEYVYTTNITNLYLTNKNFLIKFSARWVAVDATYFNPVFVCKRANASNFEFIVSYLSGNLRFSYSTDGTNLTTVTVAWTPSIDTWYTIEVERIGNNLTFVVNGSQVGATQTVTGTLFASPERLRIGGDSFNGIKFNGWIDEMSIDIY